MAPSQSPVCDAGNARVAVAEPSAPIRAAPAWSVAAGKRSHLHLTSKPAVAVVKRCKACHRQDRHRRAAICPERRGLARGRHNVALSGVILRHFAALAPFQLLNYRCKSLTYEIL